ncbi:hypothetical protein [Chitinophaga defluvii]|uniref:YopA central domain-containing protein n=1 Tax=Chitinophaga defluvii TaxID=3163343 RepID=A0ABV2T8M5_9BACT
MQTPKELLDESFADIPDRIEPSISMNQPNQELDIFTGIFELASGPNRATLNGTISFRWHPSTDTSFTGEVKADPSLILHNSMETGLSLYVDGLLVGAAHITRRIVGKNQIISGICTGSIIGDRSVAVSEVFFSVPNFRDFLGKLVRDPGTYSSHRARLEFDDSEYKIILDKHQSYKELWQELGQTGGYQILYGGKIIKHKGTISLPELRDYLFKFNNFLSFVNGARISLLFLKGVHAGATLWTDYAGYSCDSYKPSQSWANALAIDDLNGIWNKFSEIWSEPDNKQFLLLAVHWYLESNSTSVVDSSIIMVQTCLELLYNWLVVEQKKIITGSDATNISASNKIRLMISQIGISPAVPAKFTHLSNMVEENDAPEVLVWIRNCLVHGQKNKRNELAKLSDMVKFEALQLGLWYSELVLLYILGYNGNYANRSELTGWRVKGELVPWAPQPSKAVVS